MSRRSKVLFSLFAAAVTLAILLAVAVVLVARSDWFRDKVGERIVAEVRKATGGEVHLGGFQFDWTNLLATLDEFTIRGTEPADHPPLFRSRSIVVGLKVVSFLRRDVDIALLAIREPRISIEIDAQGNTNLPRPVTPRPTGDILDPFLKLAIQRIEISSGEFHYLARSVPLDFSAENLKLEALYRAGPPRYRGTLNLDRFHMASPVSLPVSFDSDLVWVLEGDGLRIERARFRSGQSTAEVTGAIDDFQPFRGSFQLETDLALADLARPLQLPVLPEGKLQASARAAIIEGGYSVQASTQASGLAFARDRLHIRGIAATAAIDAEPGLLRASDLEIRALGGQFRGYAVVRGRRSFELEGRAVSVPLSQLVSSLRLDKLAWNGAISGPIAVRGSLPDSAPPDILASARLTVQPAAGDHPLEGVVDVTYNHRARTVSFGDSVLKTGATRVDFSGSLGRTLKVALASARLDDLLPVAALFSGESPAPLPVRLENGEARFEGVVSGSLTSPQVSGKLTGGPLRYQDLRLDHLAAAVDLRPDHLRLSNLTIRKQRSHLEGAAALELDNYRTRPESLLSGNLTLTGLSLEELLSETGRELPVSGILSAAAKLNGTVARPQWLARVHVSEPVAYNEKFGLLEAELRYAPGTLEVTAGRLTAGLGALAFEGRYKHAPGDWRHGDVEFDTSGANFRLAQWQAVREFRQGLDASLGWRMHGAIEIADARPRLTALLGEAYLQTLRLDKNLLGNLRLDARSQADVLMVRGDAVLKGAKITTRAEWSLVGDSFGLGEIRFEGLTLGALHDVGLLGDPAREIYVDGFMDGNLAFTGPVLRPATWNGMAIVTRLEVAPKAKLQLRRQRDLTLRNAGPLMFGINRDGIAIQQVRLVSEDTDLSASGTLSFPKRNPWNLQIDGSLDLAVISAFEPELLAEGRSEIDAAIRGSLLQPQVQGRLRFQNASFFLKDFPNGLEQVNGAILFDRNRATVEKFTAQTGGGALALTGFVGFGGEELVYRLQAQANRVRVRYPTDVSTVLNARLDFTGTSARSLLSGEVSVLRAAFHSSTDIGSILSETARPATRPAVTSPFLRGMAFDVEILTAGEAEFTTSLTKDIEVEANLRLRGGPARPVLLGRVAVNQGEIVFFGTRYTIVQGEVTFFNPAKIEPVLAMDLETKVRGYTVMINFSGPLDQLNFSYRSDPPLQSQEILALLTVGRTPEASRVPGGQPAAGQSFLQVGGNTLLGQALATPVSSRLQRFFGVSRIKIDPQLTGVDNTPETYITVEQQVSREITLTYVTNLARTQQQIVRLEWNFSREWSVNAIRDSNGVFGVDFVYRRRF
jgi:translocation and assembly module TamB